MLGVSGQRDVAGVQLTVTPQLPLPAFATAVTPAKVGFSEQVPVAVALTHALASRAWHFPAASAAARTR